jgi:probable rRNA maturation factor
MKTICSWRRRGWPRPPATALRALATAAAELAGSGLGNDDVLLLGFVGPRTIRQVNRAFLGHDQATDVIAFDYRRAEGPPLPGEPAVEILVCPDLALARSRERVGVHYADELATYVVHGLLHAAGLDDHDPADRRRMRAAERRILARLRRAHPPTAIFVQP